MKFNNPSISVELMLSKLPPSVWCDKSLKLTPSFLFHRLFARIMEYLINGYSVTVPNVGEFKSYNRRNVVGSKPLVKPFLYFDRKWTSRWGNRKHWE